MRKLIQKTRTMAFRIPSSLSEEFATACEARYETMTAAIVRMMREYNASVRDEVIRDVNRKNRLEQHKPPRNQIETVFEMLDLSKIPQSVQDWLSEYDDSHGNMHKLLDDINADVEFGVEHKEDMMAFMELIIEANKK